MNEVTSDHINEAKDICTKGFRKSLKKCNTEAKHFVRSFTDFVDFEDILKSIHKAARPEEHAPLMPIVYHRPIDWSKYPSSSFDKGPPSENRTGGDEDGTTEEIRSCVGTSKQVEKPSNDRISTTKKVKFRKTAGR